MDRRRYPRFPVHFPLSFSGEDIFGEGLVIDLSKGGLKLELGGNQTVPTGKYLQLFLSLPDKKPLLGIDSAVVRWSRGSALGVALLYVGTEGADRLDRYVGTLERNARE